MHVYISVHICMYTYAYTLESATYGKWRESERDRYLFIMNICTWIYLYIFTQKCMYVYMCTCICVYTDVYTLKYAPYNERWGAGVETQKNVRGEIGGWGRVPFNETYAPSLSTIYDGA